MSKIIILEDLPEDEVNKLVGIDLQENTFSRLKIFKTRKDHQFLNKQFHNLKMVEAEIQAESEGLKRYCYTIAKVFMNYM